MRLKYREVQLVYSWLLSGRAKLPDTITCYRFCDSGLTVIGF